MSIKKSQRQLFQSCAILLLLVKRQFLFCYKTCAHVIEIQAVYSISRLLTKVKKRSIKKVGGGDFGISKSEIKVERCRTA